MRRWLSSILSLLLAGLLAAQAAPAAAAGYTLDQKDFSAIFLETSSQDTPWPIADLVVRNVEAQPATIALSSRDYAVSVIERGTASRLGKNALTVAFSVNGKEEGRVRLNGDLLLYGTVLCAAKKLERNHRLTAEDLATARRELGALDPAALQRPEAAIGKQLKSALHPGAILHSHQLASPTLVKRGDRVTIMAQNGTIRVSVPGQARDNGAAGDLVRVKNLMSRKEITARVIDHGMVATEL